MEIAISILRADPKEDVTPARGWALDIIEKNSAVLFSKEDREALLHKPLMELSRAEVDHILSETQRAIEGAGGFPFTGCRSTDAESHWGWFVSTKCPGNKSKRSQDSPPSIAAEKENISDYASVTV